MEKLSILLALCEGNPTVTGESIMQRTLIFLLAFWTSCWTNFRVASDLRYHQSRHHEIKLKSWQFLVCSARQGTWVWNIMSRLTCHYNDVIMGAIASQITTLTIVYSTVYSDADQRKHQSSASLAFEQGIHRGPVNFRHKWPVTRKMFPFDDVNMLKQDISKSVLQLLHRYFPQYVSSVS